MRLPLLVPINRIQEGLSSQGVATDPQPAALRRAASCNHIA
jgi:hypothetical protein